MLLFHRGCGALQTGRQLHCCPLSGVSRLATQDVGLLLHLLEENIKGQPASHPLSPSSNKNNGAPPNIPLSFPMSLSSRVPTALSSSEEAVPLFGRWAVPWLSPGGPCMVFTHLNTLLGNCLLQSSAALPPSTLPAARSHCRLGSCTAEVNRVKRVSRPWRDDRVARWSPLFASFGARGSLVPIICLHSTRWQARRRNLLWLSRKRSLLERSAGDPTVLLSVAKGKSSGTGV